MVVGRKSNSVYIRWGILLLSLILIAPLGFSSFEMFAQQSEKEKEQSAREEARDYHRKWLNEDAVYLITDEERQVFESLSTLTEREMFIEQFWFRRDSDPSTSAYNEFKEEHYRRISYANERFGSVPPGWMTDRGRIYIIHGPPTEIEARPTGGLYDRPGHEGGGTTSVFPYETWRYRYIEGLGSDIELEFVDPTSTGEYRLARSRFEKDAMLWNPGTAQTNAELMDPETERADHPFYSPWNREHYLGISRRAKDDPFERLEIYTDMQRPRPVKYADLRRLVDVKITYANLPLAIRTDYLKLNDSYALVPITLRVEHKDLSFEREGEVYRARLAFYGRVTSLANRVVAEFEDDLFTPYREEQLSQGLRQSSMYQKIISLERGIRYKLEVIVKDLHSGKVGVVQKLLAPSSDDGELSGSSLIIADSIKPLGEAPKESQMFVLGNFWIRPSITKVFPEGASLGVYLQVYNASLDQASYSPSLQLTYRILHDGNVVKQVVDLVGQSIQFYSEQRIVLIKKLDLTGIEPGNYLIQLKVEDQISNQQFTAEDRFDINHP